MPNRIKNTTKTYYNKNIPCLNRYLNNTMPSLEMSFSASVMMENGCKTKKNIRNLKHNFFIIL